MNREQSLRRLALFGVWLLAGVGLFYVPTLTGGSPWSWHVAELDVRILMGLSVGAGLLLGHWFWPTTTRWPELERFCAQVLNGPTEPNGGVWIGSGNLTRLRALVRPHVLKREGR